MPVRYVEAEPVRSIERGGVRYVEVPAHYVREPQRAGGVRRAQKYVWRGANHGEKEQVMIHQRGRAAPRRRIRRQGLYIGGAGVKRGAILEEDAASDEGGSDEGGSDGSDEGGSDGSDDGGSGGSGK